MAGRFRVGRYRIRAHYGLTNAAPFAKRIYSLTSQWLASSGVEELFVFCVQHADQVKAYVESSSWTTAIKVTCVKDTTCTNPGDALRELDKRGLVRSDPFIMMSGDVVTNVDVREVSYEQNE